MIRSQVNPVREFRSPTIYKIEALNNIVRYALYHAGSAAAIVNGIHTEKGSWEDKKR
jgi:hypothetical protein